MMHIALLRGVNVGGNKMIAMSDLRVLVEHLLGNLRILVIRGIQEDAGQRVVVGGGNRIVLVIVAAGARYRQSQKTARDHVDTVVARIRNALRFVDADRLILAPDCGMKYLPREKAFGKLSALAKAAEKVRAEL